MPTTNRRNFIKQASIAAGGLAFSSSLSSFDWLTQEKETFNFNISLAEWSLHKALFSGAMTNLDFPEVAKKQYGFEAVEYVNQFFKDKATDNTYLNQLKQRCDDNGVKSVLIMIDQEGPLADKDDTLREQAVENHYKWVEASKYLGGHAIRVNLHGDSNAEEWYRGAVKSLIKLTAFAEKMDMTILAENHGTFSSDASMMVKVMKEVNNKRCRTMVDFANFCVRREKGDLWESPCIQWYDKYKGVEELLPYAKGVSAKTFDFDSNGNESNSDFTRMLKLVKASGYKGYIGVEYEGDRLSEPDGIRASKGLLERIRKELAN
jgi:sugar phosphate isomerase/epimerase